MGNHPGKEDDNGEPPPPADAEFVEQTAIVAKPIHKNVQSIYKFKEELGSGAFSTVFKAVHKESGEIVAIKHVSKADVPVGILWCIRRRSLGDEGGLKMALSLYLTS